MGAYGDGWSIGPLVFTEAESFYSVLILQDDAQQPKRPAKRVLKGGIVVEDIKEGSGKVASSNKNVSWLIQSTHHWTSSETPVLPKWTLVFTPGILISI